MALPAGKLPGFADEIIANAEDIGGLVDALADLAAVDFAHFQAEGHVVVDAHVRIERVILKHHGDVAVHGRQFVYHGVADEHLTRANRFEARHHAQRRGLAAARGADKNHEFLIADLEVHVFDGVKVVVKLIEAADQNAGHTLSLY
jgi:hypothetical protein